MSFMINPLPYDDMTAINKLIECDKLGSQILVENEKIVQFLSLILDRPNIKFIIIDGYLGARFDEFIALLSNKKYLRLVEVKDFYKSDSEINQIIKPSLPENFKEDPAQIFGQMYRGEFEDLVDIDKVNQFLSSLNNKEVTVCYGYGSGIDIIRAYADYVVYLDVTPKEAALRLSSDEYINIGSTTTYSLKEKARRYYFVDAEITHRLRRKLLEGNRIDFYVLSNKPNQFECLTFNDLQEIFNELVKRPFRAKPIYLEGVWGGEYIQKICFLRVKKETL